MQLLRHDSRLRACGRSDDTDQFAHHGRVKDISAGKLPQDRLHRIRHGDVDVEHLTLYIRFPNSRSGSETDGYYAKSLRTTPCSHLK